MDTGISSLTADASAHRPPSPVIDDRPAATVQPAEPDARDAAAGKRTPGGDASVHSRGQPEGNGRKAERVEQTDDEGPSPATDGPRRQARLSDESLRALSAAADPSSADVHAAAAAQAYRDSQQRASPARPAFDFADRSPPTAAYDGGDAELSA